MTIQDFNEAIRQESSEDLRTLGKLKDERTLVWMAANADSEVWPKWAAD